MASKRQSALILVGHGSTLNPDSSAPTFQHADEIIRRELFHEVYCAFWKEEPSLREVLRMVDSKEVYVVPNFISEGYFTETVIPRELELSGPITERDGKVIKHCEPVGNDPRMIDLLLNRAHTVAPNVAPEAASLLIVGHGTQLNERSAEAARLQVQRIRERHVYAEVSEAYMEEAPFIADWRKLTSQPDVIVVPFFIADGLHSYQDIPELLGIDPALRPGTASSVHSTPYNEPGAPTHYAIGGRCLYYASAIGTDPSMVEVILDTIDRFDRKHTMRRPQSEEVQTGLREALARLIEQGAIGEIELEKTATGYRLFHYADRATKQAAKVFRSATDARELARLDQAGSYRPLKGAPNLPRGWVLELDSVDELRRALDYFYPAALGTWVALQSKHLKAVPLRETLNRQTGMYEIASKLTTEQAEELVPEFCNSKGKCLRTILWKTEPDHSCVATTQKSDPRVDQTGLDRQALPILCAEACNLLVAAARSKVKKSTRKSTA
jgi:sirohydrochlorin cobaltochelatase